MGLVGQLARVLYITDAYKFLLRNGQEKKKELDDMKIHLRPSRYEDGGWSQLAEGRVTVSGLEEHDNAASDCINL